LGRDWTAVCIAASIAVMILVAAYAPTCRPGDPSIRIGNMLVGGCR